MGVFTPVCVSTDGIRFFAFGRSKYFGPGTDVYLLVRSNDNPSYTLTDLTWTTISAVPIAGYNALVESFMISSYSCAIDDTGVFSILGYDPMKIYTNGLQYQPSGTSNTHSLFGGGAWKNITIPTDYLWANDAQSALFNFKDTLGRNTLMHAFVNRFGKSVFVAALDPISMTMIQGGTPWNITTEKIFTNGPITYRGNSLYVMGTIYSNNFYGWSAFPVTSSSTTPTSVSSAFNHTEMVSVCSTDLRSTYIKPLGNNGVVIICKRINPPQLFVFDGTQFKSLPPTLGLISNDFADLNNTKSMVPFIGPGTDVIPYVFMHDRFGVYSVPLNGSLAGILISGNKNVLVDGPFGSPQSNPGSSMTSVFPVHSPTGSPHGGEEGESGDNKGLIAGICAAAALMIAALFFVYFRRAKKLQRKHLLHRLHDSSLQQTPLNPVASTCVGQTTEGFEIKANDSEIEDGMGPEPVPLLLHATAARVDQGVYPLTISPQWTTAPSGMYELEPISHITQYSPSSTELNPGQLHMASGNTAVRSTGPNQWRGRVSDLISPSPPTWTHPSVVAYDSGSGSGSGLTEAPRETVQAIENSDRARVVSIVDPQTAESACSIPMPRMSYFSDPGHPHT